MRLLRLSPVRMHVMLQLGTPGRSVGGPRLVTVAATDHQTVPTLSGERRT